jgi:hypothetical protein
MEIRTIRPFWVGGSPILLGQRLEVADLVGRLYISRGDAVEYRASNPKNPKREVKPSSKKKNS